MRSASDRGCKFQNRASALQSYWALDRHDSCRRLRAARRAQSRLKTTDANQPVAIAIIAVVRP